MKRFTNDIIDVKRASADVNAIYRGQNLIWERNEPGPVFEPFVYTAGAYNVSANIQSFSKISLDGSNLASITAPGNRNVLSIKVDKFGNVYAAAFLNTAGVNQIICKYDKDLNLLWTYDTGRNITGSGFDFSLAVAVNENGQVAYTQGGRNTTLNIKYVGLLSSDGNLIWEVNEANAAMGYGPVKCLFDRNGDIITSYTGTTTLTGGGVFKWSKINGERLWRFPAFGTNIEAYTHIGTGISSDDVFYHQLGILTRINGTTGLQVWVNNSLQNSAGGPANAGVQVNKDEDVYVFNLTTNGLGKFRKIKGDNSQVLREYNIPPWNTFGRAGELALDEQGNFYTQQQSPAVVRKYRESDGVLLWTLTRGTNVSSFTNYVSAIFPQPLKTI